MNIHDKLIEACRDGNFTAVKKYLEQGANVRIWNDWPLRRAARNGHLAIVKYLIKQGANVSALALRWAAEEGHLQVVNALRKAAGDKYKCHKCIIRSTCLEICGDFRNGH